MDPFLLGPCCPSRSPWDGQQLCRPLHQPSHGTASSPGHPKLLGLCSQQFHGQGIAQSQARLRNDHKTEALYRKMKPHDERGARRVLNATAWVSKFTKHQRQEVSLTPLAKELPLRVLWVSFRAAESGGKKQQHPQNNPQDCPSRTRSSSTAAQSDHCSHCHGTKALLHPQGHVPTVSPPFQHSGARGSPSPAIRPRQS